MSTISPNENDVLLGRGNFIRTHPGNQQFRSLIDRYKPKFAEAIRGEKTAIARELMEEIHGQSPPGRFLTEPGGQTSIPFSSKKWVVADDSKALDKVLHRLRAKNLGGRDYGSSPLEEQDAAGANDVADAQCPQSEGDERAFVMSRAQKRPELDGISMLGKGSSSNLSGDIQIQENSTVSSHSKSQLSTLPGIMEEKTSSLSTGMSNEELTEEKFEVGFSPSIRNDDQDMEIMSPSALDDEYDWDALFDSDQESHSSCDASGGQVSIGIDRWMNSAISLNNGAHYWESAVNLAWVLSKHLVELQSASSLLKPENITCDNLVVLVKPNERQTEVEGVKFLFEDTPSLQHANNYYSSNRIVDPRLACLPLGNILLKIFSKGRTSSSSSVTASNEESGNIHLCKNGGVDHDVTMPSVAKRMAAVSLTRDAPYEKAKKLLFDTGAPNSICRLVCDLLDTRNDEPPSTNSITLVQGLWDLTHMKNNPQMFLFDRTSPEKALDDTCLFGNNDGRLFGREEEIDSLMAVKDSITQHLNQTHFPACSGSTLGESFLRKALFLAGYAGSGKSCLLHSLTKSCEEDKWFVLKGKFDGKSEGIMILANAFNEFFGKWGIPSKEAHQQLDPSMVEDFQKVCGAIFSSFDDEALSQLCELIPHLSWIFPTVTRHGRNSTTGSTMGSAENRLIYLIHTVINALCSSGRPVLIAIDDFHCCGSTITKGLSDFIVNYTGGESSSRHGVLIAGTYRSNEVKDGDDLFESIDSMKTSENVTLVPVGELSKGGITQLISARLGLPLRYTVELATLVHRKSRGNAFFVIQFLRTIIQNKMLEFSVRSRRWIWDCDTIEMQMISDGVAQLLTSTFDRLPADLLQTLKIISLFGSQIDVSTIAQLNDGNQILSFDMNTQLDMAVKENLLDRAGPLYAFSHDLIHQTLYDLMPTRNLRLLHKVAGERLLESTTDDDSHTMHLLAVDQINLFCNEGNPTPGERWRYAKANASAARYAMAASSFEKARSYVDMGMKLLEPDHWKVQYSLSLELYELSASISFIFGDKSMTSSCLDAIITHCTSFQDSLNASEMLARLLFSSYKHNEATVNCIQILAQLGETFPTQPNIADVLTKLAEVKPLLLVLTVDRLKPLPKMEDTTKLQAMKFLGMLCSISFVGTPMLLPLLSVRMIKLSFQFGFCSESILGLFYTAYSLFLFTDDVQMAYRVGKVGETLREESPSKHILKSRLIREWDGSIKVMVEPMQAVAAEFPSLFDSSKIAGDSGSAEMCRFVHCAISLAAGENLTSLSKNFALCIQQAAQQIVLYAIMALYRVIMRVSGMQTIDDIKTYDELTEIARGSGNEHLLTYVLMAQMFELFYYRDYKAIMELSENHPQRNYKRIMSIWCCFFEGISALNIARQQSNQPKYRIIGENLVKDFAKFAQNNKWTFDNKLLLLQAELHYLKGDCSAAEDAYIASIKSARAHKFIQEEAMAHELLGIFCLENKRPEKASENLLTALKLYKQWGANSKAADLEKYIFHDVDPFCDLVRT